MGQFVNFNQTKKKGAKMPEQSSIKKNKKNDFIKQSSERTKQT